MKSLPGRPVLAAPPSPGLINNALLLSHGNLALKRGLSYKKNFEVRSFITFSIESLKDETAVREGGSSIVKFCLFSTSRSLFV